jgi:methylated-DNA-[protein]-cysteine S-methyltransferase
MMSYRLVETSFGVFGLVARDDRLVGTFLPDRQRAILKRIGERYPDAVENNTLLPQFCKQASEYFNGKPVKFRVKIDLSGMPPFRQAVLNACLRVPFGKTASYGDLALAAGSPGAARAVGGAMAHNPLPLIIPCHRILRSDGSIGGFSSPRGIKEKQRLLRLEGIVGWEQAA